MSTTAILGSRSFPTAPGVPIPVSSLDLAEPLPDTMPPGTRLSVAADNLTVTLTVPAAAGVPQQVFTKAPTERREDFTIRVRSTLSNLNYRT